MKERGIKRIRMNKWKDFKYKEKWKKGANIQKIYKFMTQKSK